jgi:hypothetical protein
MLPLANILQIKTVFGDFSNVFWALNNTGLIEISASVSRIKNSKKLKNCS